jgi:hypothetical protein
MVPRIAFYFSGIHPVALYYHTLQNMPAIATETIVTLFFTTCFSPYGLSSGGIQHKLSFQSAVNTATDPLFCIVCPCGANYFNTYSFVI